MVHELHVISGQLAVVQVTLWCIDGCAGLAVGLLLAALFRRSR